MKITQFCNHVLPVQYYGGIERVTVWLIQGLKELGHDVSLIAPKGSALPGIKTFYIEKPYNIPEEYPDIKNLIPKDSEVLHYQNGYSPINYGIPTLHTIHGQEFKGFPLDKTYNFASDYHRRSFNLPSNPFIYHGLNLKEFTFRENKSDYLLYLNQLDRRGKVNALKKAIELAKRTKTRLIIAGTVNDMSFIYGKNIFDRGLSQHFGEYCTYIGPVGGKLKVDILANAKALLNPLSSEDAFGLINIEAMACGTPVIGSNFAAIPEIVEDGKTGFICNNDDEFISAIKNCGGIKPSDCRKRVEEKFNHIKMAEGYVKLYKELLS